MAFEFQRLDPCPEVVLIRPEARTDSRGWFAEIFKASAFKRAGIPSLFVQENHAHSARPGVVRGLHFQDSDAPQGKLVRCVNGRVFDVAVDVRKDSPTHGRWVGQELSSQNRAMVWIPPGFAHGYASLSTSSDVVYLVTGEYAPQSERSVRWNDPAIGIKWPVEDAVLAPRDTAAPLLADVQHGFTYSGDQG